MAHLIPKTYGLAKMAGTVNPTTNRNANHDVKFHVSELNTHATISSIRYA